MITYNDIYEALRKEKYSEKLQPLGKKFILDVAKYIEEKKKLAEQNKDLFSDEIMKIRKQMENAKSIFDEMVLLRKKKLLGLVFVASETGISKQDFENMLDFEKELFDKILELMKDAEKKLLSQFEIKFSGEEKEGKELKLLLFLDNVEELVGFGGESLGPFVKGEVVNLPKDIADILISDKKAEMIGED